MKNIQNNKQQGLIKMIILIIIAIAVLSWYGVDIKQFFTSEMAQNNFSYVWNFIKEVWSNYLVEPVSKVWGMLTKYVIQPIMGLIFK